MGEETEQMKNPGGRPRNAEASQAVLTSTIRLLSERGYAGLSHQRHCRGIRGGEDNHLSPLADDDSPRRRRNGARPGTTVV